MTGPPVSRSDELKVYVNELIEQSRLDDEIEVPAPSPSVLARIRKATTSALIERFIALAMKQNDETVRSSERKKLYYLAGAIEAELKSRDGDQRRALRPLLKHADPGVRLRAASALLALDRRNAVAVLEQVRDEEDFPADAQARGLLLAMSEGRYRPD